MDRDFRAQNRANPRRCHPITVAGWTIASVSTHRDQMRETSTKPLLTAKRLRVPPAPTASFHRGDGSLLTAHTLAARAVESFVKALPPSPTAKSTVSPAATIRLIANENEFVPPFRLM
jgi:hypothetical protein